jgi:hypothetical protein
VAGLVWVFGPHLWVGRLIALLATLAAGGLVALAVHQETHDRLAASAAGLLFLASHYVYHIAPLARVNTLALALGLAAIYFVSKRQLWATAVGLCFLFCAVYTKQTSIDAVVATLAFLVVWRWRQALAGGTILGLAGLGTALWVNRATGGQFYRNCIEGNINDFKTEQVVAFFQNFTGSHTLILGGAVVALWLTFHRRIFNPWPVYFVAGLAMAVTVGKWGAGESYFLAAIASASILSGYTMAAVRRVTPGWAMIVLPVLILIQLRLFWHAPLDEIVPGWRDTGPQAAVLGHLVTPQDHANGWRIAAYLQQTPLDVLSEEVGFNIAARKNVIGNTTQIKNLHLAGLWDDQFLIQDLDERRFGVVILNGQQYPQPVLDAIGRNYEEIEAIEMNRFRYMVLLSEE